MVRNGYSNMKQCDWYCTQLLYLNTHNILDILVLSWYTTCAMYPRQEYFVSTAILKQIICFGGDTPKGVLTIEPFQGVFMMTSNHLPSIASWASSPLFTSDHGMDPVVNRNWLTSSGTILNHHTIHLCRYLLAMFVCYWGSPEKPGTGPWCWVCTTSWWFGSPTSWFYLPLAW